MGVPQTWGVWELEFYHDTLCSSKLLNGVGSAGVAIASSELSRGFGHSIDHSAPYGAHTTSGRDWQSTHEPPLEQFLNQGPATFAFDGNLETNWWANCKNPCWARSQWLGRNYSTLV